MTLIAEGSGEDDEADEEMRRDAVDEFLVMLDDDLAPDSDGLPECLLQIMCARPPAGLPAARVDPITPHPPTLARLVSMRSDLSSSSAQHRNG